MAIVCFDAKKEEGDEIFTTTDKEARIHVKVTWGFDYNNKSNLEDMPISPPFATKRLRLVKKKDPIFDRYVSDFVESADSQPRDLAKLLEATKWLNNLISGAVEVKECLYICS